MAEPDEDQLESLLREYLSESLDPQRGRSEQYFRGYLEHSSQSVWRRRVWLVGAFVSGIAASVAALWASPLFRLGTPGHGSPLAVVGPNPSLVTPAITPVAEQVIQTRLTDQGVILLDDNTPVRVVHRQVLRQTQWFDDRDGVRSREVTPQDDLLLIKLTTY